MLQSGNSVTLRAKGNSMLPFIMEERDTVVLQKVEAFAAVVAFLVSWGLVILLRRLTGKYARYVVG